MISGWQGEAFNQDPDSPNEIHGDDLARQYGFHGGLVPGVTVSAYLAHPAIEAWGEDFLARGHMHARIVSPLYDGETFAVTITEQSTHAYQAELLRPDCTLSATATVGVTQEVPPAPTRRGDPTAPDNFNGLEPNRESCEQLRKHGCLAFPFHWGPEHIMRTYLRQDSRMPELLRGASACANMSYILGISNWTAAGNLNMNPWVHLETHSQNYGPIGPDTRIIAEMKMVDLFEKKGHEFFDADVNLFDQRDDSCLTAIRLRAIYQLRRPE